MDITCSICNDSFDAIGETYTTPCGHIFHYECLIQWIHQSKTCPQCRQKTTEKTIKRLYFNINSVEPPKEDESSLKIQLQSTRFELKVSQKKLHDTEQECGKLVGQNTCLRTELSNSEMELSRLRSVNTAFLEKIKMLKNHCKENDKLTDELRITKEKLTEMETLHKIVLGSKEDVDEVLKNNNNSSSLQLIVVALKSQLEKSEHKRNKMLSQWKQANTNAVKYQKETEQLQKVIEGMKHQIENTCDIENERKLLKQKLTDLIKSDDENSSNETMLRMIGESPMPQNFKFKLKKNLPDESSTDSDSSTSKISTRERKINEDSFFVTPLPDTLCSDFIDLTKSASKLSEKHVKASRSQRSVIVKKPQGSFDGMGGYTKDESIPCTSNQNKKKTLKRTPSTRSKTGFTKRRKLAPIPRTFNIDTFLDK